MTALPRLWQREREWPSGGGCQKSLEYQRPFVACALPPLAGQEGVQLLAVPFRLMLDFALPQRCPSCGAMAPNGRAIDGANGGVFCQECWNQLKFLGPPCCASCDLPLPYETERLQKCAECLAKPPQHDGIKAAVAYGDIARHVALRLKYAGRIGLAQMIAVQLMRHVRDLPTDALLVPVPLHWTRLWGRSFNQSVLIAREISAVSGHRLCPDLLRRTRRTSPLGGLSGKERRNMVAGAFSVHEKRTGLLQGRHILLVDDVYTSGATTDACIRTLKKGGASAVTILCWTRVLPAGLETANAT